MSSLGNVEGRSFFSMIPPPSSGIPRLLGASALFLMNLPAVISSNLSKCDKISSPDYPDYPGYYGNRSYEATPDSSMYFILIPAAAAVGVGMLICHCLKRPPPPQIIMEQPETPEEIIHYILRVKNRIDNEEIVAAKELLNNIKKQIGKFKTEGDSSTIKAYEDICMRIDLIIQYLISNLEERKALIQLNEIEIIMRTEILKKCVNRETQTDCSDEDNRRDLQLTKENNGLRKDKESLERHFAEQEKRLRKIEEVNRELLHQLKGESVSSSRSSSASRYSAEKDIQIREAISKLPRGQRSVLKNIQQTPPNMRIKFKEGCYLALDEGRLTQHLQGIAEGMRQWQDKQSCID